MSGLFESFLATPEVSNAFSDRSLVQAMLRFEAALARAQAAAGLLDAGLAQSIIGTCQVELFDVARLVRESADTRSLAIPLVSHLRETVALFNPLAAEFVHLGCSDTDLVDTTLTLVTRDVIQLIMLDLAQTITSLHDQARQHANAPMLTRSNLESPCLSSFGWMLCQWSTPLVRTQRRLTALLPDVWGLRLGSSLVATAQLQDKARDVVTRMAAELQLKIPDFVGQKGYDERVALACELGLLTSQLGKIAADMAHLAQPEILEISLPGITSSPDTLNMLAQSATQRVPQQVATLLLGQAQGSAHAHGHWQSELTQWPALLASSHAISRAVTQLVRCMQPNPERMRTNLDATRNLSNPKDAKTRFGAALLRQANAMTQLHLKTLQMQAS